MIRARLGPGDVGGVACLVGDVGDVGVDIKSWKPGDILNTAGDATGE